MLRPIKVRRLGASARGLPAGAGGFDPNRVALSVAFAFNDKWTYCEFHPPVSKGGRLVLAPSGAHLDELQMFGGSVPRLDHLVTEKLTYLRNEWLNRSLDVVVRELADRNTTDVEQSLFKVV